MVEKCRRPAVVVACLILLTFFDMPSAAGQARQPGPAKRSNQAKRPAAPARLPCGTLLDFFVRLDKLSFSPGEIDQRSTANLRRALGAFQAANNLSVTSQPDCNTWKRLQDASIAAAADYDITADDVKGPFTKEIPQRLEDQGALPALEYRSPLERLSEKFHAAPRLLRQMNPAAKFDAGERIKVPAVTPFDASAKPAPDARGDITITVSKEESSLRATTADGTLVFFAPVSSGSEHDPLPLGQWTVTEVAWRPAFHYNPDLFWDADPRDASTAIKPGPNNPVGVVWIGINVEHYGLHGSPDPSRVGQTESHGCIRLTNWDAARVASFVKRGTRLVFQ
jgi:lipoprotein-anchoring transpeptidase ErfK/SrfK